VISHQHELEMDYKGDECLLTIIKSNCCKYEELVSLTTHGNYHLFVGQMTTEISEAIPQFSDLQIKESGSNHEEQNFQGGSNLQLEHQEDPPYPYEYVVSNYDEEQGEIFPNLFHDPIVDTSIQEASSLSLRSYLDAPIFYQYSDEEEDVKICEDLLFTQISSSSTFQQRYDHECVHVVVDASYKSINQNCCEDQNFIFESVADIKGNPQSSYLKTHEDCSRYREEDDELKGPDQQFIMHSYRTEIKQSIFSTEIYEGKEKHCFFQLE
jgi:hypothetical protein